MSEYSEYTIKADGEQSVYEVPRLKTQIIEAIAAGNNCIVVDLSHSEYLDCTALGVLIGGKKRCREAGGDLYIKCDNNPRIWRIFEVTNLDRIFERRGDEKPPPLVMDCDGREVKPGCIGVCTRYPQWQVVARAEADLNMTVISSRDAGILVGSRLTPTGWAYYRIVYDPTDALD